MLKQQTQTKKPAPGLETQGPVMSDMGYSPSQLPPNPSDEIFMGRKLPVIPPQDQVQRRDFSIPIRPTLHYRDGLDGAAETVTVAERRFMGNSSQGTGEADRPQYQTGREDTDDHAEFGNRPGTDPNKYSRGRNDAYTLNGEWIRGT